MALREAALGVALMAASILITIATKRPELGAPLFLIGLIALILAAAEKRR